ncbi:delphilin-like [Dorcoceras hygrometricum]|uniref:Delphilin-like n=1 Tax=Dorcoceras hygrometricum TaxID=472368 RepID=A0A2Z7BHN9_9LAMI|nr:delphilin-like [Dorcoceras hygrometricum]
MASAFITNAYQVHFESVLVIPDHEGILNMFRALEASGFRGFLGCESVLYEKELEQFFDTTLVQNGDITGAVSGKFFSVSQSRFAEVFALPTEGLVDFSDVPKNMVFDARSIFLKSDEQVSTHGKKKFMKYEYRLLNDNLAKAITVKAGSFDAVTNESFLMMTDIHFGLQVNWSKILFSVLKEMVDKTQKKANGFAAQICVLLKSIPAITMGDAVPFPTSKVLSITIVNYYIAMNHTFDARGQYEEPSMANVAVVKRKSKSKRKLESTDETPVEVISEVAGSKKRPAIEGNEPVIPKKRRTVKRKASPSKASLDVVPVAQDVVPLQIFEPTPAAKSPAPKRKSRKRRLLLSTGSDDENLDEQEPVKDTTEVTDKETTVKHTDEVDVIIGQVLEETSMLATDETEPGDQRIDETEIGDDFEKWLDESFKDFASRDDEPAIGSTSGMDRGTGTEERVAYEQSLEMVDETGTTVEADGSEKEVAATNTEKSVGNKHSNEEKMSLDDLLMQIFEDMMPSSVTAAEVTKIRLEESIAINEVQERDCYYANLPGISTHDKGKEPLEEDEPVKGNPARETVELICGDVDFLVQLRDQKEKLMLDWAETDSLETAVRRKMYILAKYREMLLRKFLDSHRRYFAPGQPWTAMASQIIDLLSAVHSKSLEDLQEQQQEHGIEMVQPSSSLSAIDSTAGSGAVLAQFYSMAKSTCWVRPMILIDGIWTPIQGTDYWNSSCRLSLFVNRKQVLESVVDTTFVPHGLFIEPVQYWGAAPSLNKTWDGLESLQRLLDIFILMGQQFTASPQHDSFTEAESAQPRVHVESSSMPSFSVSDPVAQVQFIQRPDSPTHTDSPKRFDNDDIPLDATTDHQILLPVGPTEFNEALDDLRTFIIQRIDDSNSEISKINTLDRSFREALLHRDEAYGHSLQSVRQDNQRQGDVQIVHINEFKKGPGSWRHFHCRFNGCQEGDFRAQAQHTLNIITDQLSELVDYINRGGNDKKGEGSSSRPQPPPDDQGVSSGGRGTGDGGRGTGHNVRTTSFVERLMDAYRARERSRRNMSGYYKRRR